MAESPDHQTAAPARKFAKLACDQCHRCKLRCTRELPKCERCRNTGSPCTFSTGKPLGKPRGSKNKHPRRRQPFDGEEQPAASRRRQQHDTDVAAFDALLQNQSLLDAQQTTPPPLPSRRHDSIDWHSSLSPEWSAGMSDLLADTNFDGFNIGDSFHHLDQQQQKPQHQGQSPASDTAMLPPAATNEASSRSSIDSHIYSTFAAPAQVDLHYAANLQHTDLHPLAAFSAPDDASSARLATAPCACGPTAISVFSMLHQHVERGQRAATTTSLTTQPHRIDRSLSLLHTSIMLCERSLGCAVCRANASSGALLCLLLLNRAMWCYIELLSGTSASPSPSSTTLGPSCLTGGENASAFGVNEVTIGGLEVAEDGLRARVIEAIIRAEMKKGIRVLCMFERVLAEPDAAAEGDRLASASLGLGRKIGGLMGQLVRGLREEFENWK